MDVTEKCPKCKKRKIAFKVRIRNADKVFEEIALCKKCYEGLSE